MSEEFSEQSLLTAHCIVSAARAAGYLAEGEPMQSAPELAELEKNQAERVKDLLDKVKSGEFKMPERRRMPPPVKERKK